MASAFTVTNGKAMFPRHWDHGSIPEPEPTYSLVAGSLPTGLAFNTTPGSPYYGCFTGTPNDTPGDFVVTIRSNNGGANVDLVVTITVAAAVTIAQSGGPNYPVYYWNDPSSTKAQEAAVELALRLNSLVTGGGIFTAADGSGLGAAPSTGFLVGAVPFTGYELPDCVDAYEGVNNPFRFVVKMVGDTYLVRGGTPREHKDGVRYLLENYFGFLYGEVDTGPQFEGAEPAWLITYALNSVRVKGPAAAALPLTAPRMETVLRHRFVHSADYNAEWLQQEWMDWMGVPDDSAEFGFAQETCGLAIHGHMVLFTSVTAGFHPTQGAYAQEQPAFVVKNPGTVGITGTFDEIDETVEVRRSGTPICTAKLTWPAKGNALYVFVYDKTAGAIVDGDTIHGLTSGASATITSYVTDAYPMIWPTAASADDAYDPTKRLRFVDATTPGHCCYSDDSLPLVISLIFRRYYAGMTPTDMAKCYFFFGTKDWFGEHCECARCQAIYDGNTWVDDSGATQRPESETLVRMWNAWVADIRAYAGFENARVGGMPYFDTRDGPASAMAAGTVAYIPIIRACAHHSSIGRACPSNRGYDMDSRRWTAMAAVNGAAITYWYYLFNFGGNFLNGIPSTDGIFERARRCREMKTRHVQFQSPNSGGGDRSALRGWMLARILREPWYPVRFWQRVYFDRYCAAAADDLNSFCNLIEDSTFINGQPRWHLDEFQTIPEGRATWNTSALRTAAQGYRDAALVAATGDSDLTRYIHEMCDPILASWRSAFATLTGEVWSIAAHPDEPGEFAIFRDLQDGAGPVYLSGLAQFAIENRRGCAPNEYSNGPPTVLGFRAINGGKVKILEDGLLRVEVVCDVHRLYIWRISYNGVDIVPRTQESDRPSGITRDDLYFYPFPGAGGVIGDSGQGGQDDGCEWVSDPSALSTEVRTWVGLSAWGGPPPDGFHYAVITVNGQAADPYVEIAYSLMQSGLAGANTSCKPYLAATYVGGVTITPDLVNSRYDVTGIAGLTGITVRDEFLDLGHALEAIREYNPDAAFANATRVTVAADFAAGTIPASRTDWCRRRITILGT